MLAARTSVDERRGEEGGTPTGDMLVNMYTTFFFAFSAHALSYVRGGNTDAHTRRHIDDLTLVVRLTDSNPL